MEYAFDEPPAVGFTHEKHGNTYVLREVRPYVRKDGAPTTLLVWSGWCAVCDAEFELALPLTCKAMNRRCNKHKSGKAATHEARAASREGGKRGLATQRANRRAAKAEREREPTAADLLA